LKVSRSLSPARLKFADLSRNHSLLCKRPATCTLCLPVHCNDFDCRSWQRGRDQNWLTCFLQRSRQSACRNGARRFAELKPPCCEYVRPRRAHCLTTSGNNLQFESPVQTKLRFLSYAVGGTDNRADEKEVCIEGSELTMSS